MKKRKEDAYVPCPNCGKLTRRGDLKRVELEFRDKLRPRYWCSKCVSGSGND